MKRIDFENGTVTGNILGVALPMLAAQLLNLLYNIVDRVYIARIPHEGTAALGAVGICFPLIVIITAFANLFGGGGAPLFSIYRGKKEEKTAVRIMNTSFSMICASAVLLMIGGFLFAYPIHAVISSLRKSRTFNSALLARKKYTNIADIVCDNTVAIAAPLTPSPRIKINIGSRIRFAAAPTATEDIPISEYPCALMNGFIPTAIIEGTVPIR